MSNIQEIKKIYQDLSVQNDLSPHNPIVNKNLSNLVQQLNKTREDEDDTRIVCCDTCHQERVELPALCGQAECEMEKYWARFFLEKEQMTPTDLTEFWYHDNYQALWNAEKELMAANNCQNKRIVFLGSGALPLTMILGAISWPNLKAVCVDFDDEAVDFSRSLIKKLNLEKQIEVQCISAQSYLFNSNDFVICASLLKNKSEVYNALYKADITCFAIRDVEGCYCYLYHPAERPCSEQYTEKFTEQTKTGVNHNCINTTKIFVKTSLPAPQSP